MPAGYLSPKYAVWSTTQRTVATDALDLSADTDLGELAPGTALGDVEIQTSDGFGRSVAVGASQSPRVVTYGTTVAAGLTTARDANPPTSGYLYVVNKSLTHATEFAVTVKAAHLMPISDDDARQRVVYEFHADGDVPEDFVTDLPATAGVSLP